jgi:sarcosine oxidase, subunit alpha
VSVAFTWEGAPLAGEPGASLAAALHAAGIRVLGRSWRRSRPRGLYCLAGACDGCQVLVDGVATTACTTVLRGGERVEPGRSLVPLPADPPPLGGYEELEVDVLVVGAGEAGLHAAATADGRVLVVERDREPGGWLLAEPDGRQRIAPLLAAAARAEVRTGATFLGQFADGVCGVVTAAGLTAVRAGRIEAHPGFDERGLAFAGNDLPGILLAAGAQRLLVRDGVPAGRQVVVAATDGDGDRIAGLLREAGSEVVIVPAAAVTAAHGDEMLEAVTVDGATLACDALLLAVGRRPARLAIAAAAGPAVP